MNHQIFQINYQLFVDRQVKELLTVFLFEVLVYFLLRPDLDRRCGSTILIALYRVYETGLGIVAPLYLQYVFQFFLQRRVIDRA